MTKRLWTVLLFLILSITIVADQATKKMAIDSLRYQPSRVYAGGVLTLVYTENSGAFLSLGSTLPPAIRTLIFNVLVAIALVVALVYLVAGQATERLQSLALTLFIAGGFGNLIDRVTHSGRVVDFMYLALGPLHTGVFNVADIAITTGAVCLLAGWFLESRGRKTSAEAPPLDEGTDR